MGKSAGVQSKVGTTSPAAGATNMEVVKTTKKRTEAELEVFRQRIQDAIDEDAPVATEYRRALAEDVLSGTERDQKSSELDGLERKMRDHQKALIRIKNGTYGICEETGERISDARLHACLTATTAILPGS